jgi:hypothetical protein
MKGTKGVVSSVRRSLQHNSSLRFSSISRMFSSLESRSSKVACNSCTSLLNDERWLRSSSSEHRDDSFALRNLALLSMEPSLCLPSLVVVAVAIPSQVVELTAR